MQRLPTGPNETPKDLFNPLKSDFKARYDGKDYLIPSYEISTFPTYMADRFAEKIAHEVVMTRGISVNYEEDKKEVLKEIFVEL